MAYGASVYATAPYGGDGAQVLLVLPARRRAYGGTVYATAPYGGGSTATVAAEQAPPSLPAMRMVRKGIQHRHRIRIRAVATVDVTTLTTTPITVAGRLAATAQISASASRRLAAELRSAGTHTFEQVCVLAVGSRASCEVGSAPEPTAMQRLRETAKRQEAAEEADLIRLMLWMARG